MSQRIIFTVIGLALGFGFPLLVSAQDYFESSPDSAYHFARTHKKLAILPLEIFTGGHTIYHNGELDPEQRRKEEAILQAQLYQKVYDKLQEMKEYRKLIDIEIQGIEETISILKENKITTSEDLHQYGMHSLSTMLGVDGLIGGRVDISKNFSDSSIVGYGDSDPDGIFIYQFIVPIPIPVSRPRYNSYGEPIYTTSKAGTTEVTINIWDDISRQVIYSVYNSEEVGSGTSFDEWAMILTGAFGYEFPYRITQREKAAARKLRAKEKKAQEKIALENMRAMREAEKARKKSKKQ